MDETAIKLNQNLRNEVFDDHSELTNLIFANLATPRCTAPLLQGEQVSNVPFMHHTHVNKCTAKC